VTSFSALASISWHDVFFERFLWGDLLLFGIPAVVHVLAWRRVGELSNDAAPSQSAASSIGTAASAALAAVGFLLPLSLVAVQVVTDHSHGVRSQHVALDVFVADLWFGLALLFGLFVLFVAGYESGSRNVMNVKSVVLPLGWQFFALITGVVRLIVAIAGIVGGA
jgi:hypothetical protein